MNLYEHMMNESRNLNKSKKSRLKEGNPVTDKLPGVVDSFLQDIAQFTNLISYRDIMNHEYTDAEIKRLKSLGRKWNREYEYAEDDPESAEIIKKIEKEVASIVKGDNSLTEESVDTAFDESEDEGTTELKEEPLKESLDDEAMSIIDHYDTGGHGGLGYAIDDSFENFLWKSEDLPWDEDTERFDCSNEELLSAWRNYNQDPLWTTYYGLSDREASVVADYLEKELISSYGRDPIEESTKSRKKKMKESKLSRDNYAVKQITFDVIVPGDEDLAVGPDGKFYNALYRACKDAGYVIASDAYGWESEDITDLYKEIGVVDEILDELNESTKSPRKKFNSSKVEIGDIYKIPFIDLDTSSDTASIMRRKRSMDYINNSNPGMTVDGNFRVVKIEGNGEGDMTYFVPEDHRTEDTVKKMISDGQRLPGPGSYIDPDDLIIGVENGYLNRKAYK